MTPREQALAYYREQAAKGKGETYTGIGGAKCTKFAPTPEEAARFNLSGPVVLTGPRDWR